MTVFVCTSGYCRWVQGCRHACLCMKEQVTNCPCEINKMHGRVSPSRACCRWRLLPCLPYAAAGRCPPRPRNHRCRWLPRLLLRPARLPNPHYFNFSGTFRIPIGDMPISLLQQEIRPIFDACCKDPLLSLWLGMKIICDYRAKTAVTDQQCIGRVLGKFSRQCHLGQCRVERLSDPGTREVISVGPQKSDDVEVHTARRTGCGLMCPTCHLFLFW